MDSPHSTPSTPSPAVGKTTPCPTHTHTPPPEYSPAPPVMSAKLPTAAAAAKTQANPDKCSGVRSLNASPGFPDRRGFMLWKRHPLAPEETQSGISRVLEHRIKIYTNIFVLYKKGIWSTNVELKKKRTFQDKKKEKSVFFSWCCSKIQTLFSFLSHFSQWPSGSFDK